MVSGPDVGVIAIMCGSVIAVVSIIGKAFTSRIGNAPRVPAEIADRLARMEHAIDSIAVEVERISEGQRFTTKLLSDRTGEPGAPERSATGNSQ